MGAILIAIFQLLALPTVFPITLFNPHDFSPIICNPLPDDFLFNNEVQFQRISTASRTRIL